MPSQTFLQRVKDETGISSLFATPRDVHILLLTRCIRMCAYGSSTLVLALYFSTLGHPDTKIGLFLSLTLVGDVGISLLLTLVADSLGRRRILIVGGLLMSFSGVVFAMARNYWILLLAAIVGVISPSGNEIGPFRAVEGVDTRPAIRSEDQIRYLVIGTLGGASGSLAGRWAIQSLQAKGWSEVASFRFIFWGYAVLGFCKAGLTMFLSHKCEAPPATFASHPPSTRPEETEVFLPANSSEPVLAPAPSKKRSAFTQISPASRRTLFRLCSLFCFDSLASGLVPNSLVAFYISRKFSLAEGKLGSIIAFAQFLSSIGNMLASAVAKRIGLVKTMVFTHLPSAILLSLVPLPTSLGLTIAFLALRASLASMDQAPRSAFLSAIVLPTERTAVMGIVNTVKTISQSSSPMFTGLMANDGHFWVAFLLAGALKASYDVGLLALFLNTKLESDDHESSHAAIETGQEFELCSESEPEDENDDSKTGMAEQA